MDVEASAGMDSQSPHTPERKSLPSTMTAVADPLTPSLENWKLSDATRALVQGHGYGSMTLKGRQIRETYGDMMQDGNSPLTPCLPETTQYLSSPLQKSCRQTLERSQSLRLINDEDFYGGDEDLMATPKAIEPSRVIEDTFTPPTPTLLSSPLRTCTIQENAVLVGQLHNYQYNGVLGDRSSPIGEEDSGDDEIDLYHILRDFKPITPLKTRKTPYYEEYTEDDDMEPGIDFSPPKLAKVLVPSKILVADGLTGWIPLVSEAEFANTHGFLRKQVYPLI
jgi:hypothetical protein